MPPGDQPFALPVVVGLPVGLVVGRLVFTAFADRVGALNGALVPWALLALLLLGIVVLANIAAIVPGRRVRRIAPAPLLRPE